MDNQHSRNIVDSYRENFPTAVKEKMRSLGRYKTYLRTRWLGLLYIYVALMGWHVLTARSASAMVAIGLLAAVLVAFFLGDIVLKCILNDKPAFDTLSFRLLTGVLTGIVLLYVSALVLRLGLLVDAAMIAAAVTALWFFVRKGSWTTAFSAGDAAESIILPLDCWR